MLPLALIAVAATPVGVGLDEWSLAAYRARVPAGVVAFNVRNRGEDAHDLAVRTAKGRVVARSPEIASGATSRLKVRLRTPGTYTLVCTLPGHEQLGMRATIRVTRRR